MFFLHLKTTTRPIFINNIKQSLAFHLERNHTVLWRTVIETACRLHFGLSEKWKQLSDLCPYFVCK